MLISFVSILPLLLLMFGLISIKSGGIANIMVGLIALTPIYLMAMFCIKPRIELENNKLIYRTPLNQKVTLTDFNTIDVFINKQDILFRFEPNIEKIASLFYIDEKNKIEIAKAIENENFKTVKNNL